MPRLSYEAQSDQRRAILAALKKVDAAPVGVLTDFTVAEYGLPFLRALLKWALATKAPRQGADGTYKWYRARLVPAKAPTHLEVSIRWRPRPEYKE